MKFRFVPLAPAAGLLVASAESAAQSVGKMLESDVRNFGRDVLAVWTSPLRARPSDWLVAGAVIGTSGAASAWDDNVDRWVVRTRNAPAWSALKEVREGGIAFSGKTITPIALGTLALGLATKNAAVQDGLFGCLASYVSGSVVRNQVAYRLIARRRPSPDRDIDSPPADNDDQYDFGFPGESDWGQHSLPAGHAANIVACASFLNNRFSMGVIEPALYVVSAGVGVGRIVDRRHWTSDTMVGMAFGYAIGKQVAQRSAERAAGKNKSKSGTSDASSSFFISPGTAGTMVGWQKVF